MVDFFTLSDSKATTLEMRDLLLINMCQSILVPDPKGLPFAFYVQSIGLNSITYSRCVCVGGLHYMATWLEVWCVFVIHTTGQ